MPDQERDVEKTIEETEMEEEVLEETETGAEPKEEVATPRLEEIEELERENTRLIQQLLRLKADFENLRRRSKTQMEDLVLTANEELLQSLLPVLDNLERALHSQEASQGGLDSFFEGVKMVYQGLMQVLEKHGLERVEAIGRPFDPVFHEAVFMEGEGEGPLIVLEETQSGYILNGKVIRHTKVLVGKMEEEE